MTNSQSPSGSVRRRTTGKLTGRSKSGCLTCRSKKVKCDEGVPSCGRCLRLKLVCHQAHSRIIPSERVRDQPRIPQEPISLLQKSSPQSLPTTSPSNQLSEQPHMMQRIHSPDTFGYDQSIASTANIAPSSTGSNSSFNFDSSILDPYDISSVQSFSLPEPNSALGHLAGLSLPFPRIPDVLQDDGIGPWSPFQAAQELSKSVTQECGIPLNDDDRRALDHFRTAFSLSQTTRDPEWSTPALLLRHALQKSEMLLHFIIAISLADMALHFPSSQQLQLAALAHYESGTQKIMRPLEDDSFSTHISRLGSFYCIYIYMSAQRFFSKAKLDRLSLTTTDYIKQHSLANASLSPFDDQDRSAERSFVSRLIMWLIKSDSQCTFLGSTPSVIYLFQEHPNDLTTILSDSRLALQLNWGARYPISQSIRDIESCLPVDMMSEMLIIFANTSDICCDFEDKVDETRWKELHRQLDLIEMKYSAVFYYGSSAMTLQPAMKLNCANSATMLYALRIYLLRLNTGFGSQQYPESAKYLSKLLKFARYVCPMGTHQPVYEFQWSLFIAAMETTDMIHQEWLYSRITEKRFCEALKRISAIQKTDERLITMPLVRHVLLGV